MASFPLTRYTHEYNVPIANDYKGDKLVNSCDHRTRGFDFSRTISTSDKTPFLAQCPIIFFQRTQTRERSSSLDYIFAIGISSFFSSTLSRFFTSLLYFLILFFKTIVENFSLEIKNFRFGDQKLFLSLLFILVTLFILILDSIIMVHMVLW